MIDQALAKGLYKVLQKTIDDDTTLPEQKYASLFRLFNFILNTSAQNEDLNFNSNFVKLNFLANKYGIKANKLFLSHELRRLHENDRGSKEINHLLIQRAHYVITIWINVLSNVDIPETLFIDPADPALQSFKQTVSYKGNITVHLVEYKSKDHIFIVLLDDAQDKPIQLIFDAKYKNDHLLPLMKMCVKYMSFPLKMSLVDVKEDADKNLIPANVVFDPDFLVDVTTISECFKHDGISVLGLLTRKFLPVETSTHLAIGNIANLMLDQLVYDIHLSFNDISKQIFALSPLSFCLFDDDTLRKVMSSLKNHFMHIKASLQHQFVNQNISASQAYVEPSFYSALFGLQGRLDLFHVDKEKKLISIVELKSGKPFKANRYGLNINHYTQTLLYFLMVDNGHRHHYKMLNYILYSTLDQQNLRYAPTIKSKIQEALAVRNKIRMLEESLLNIDASVHDFEDLLDVSKIPKSWKFLKRDLGHLQKAFKTLDDLEKRYILKYISMVSLERMVAKKGQANSDKNHGFAALWARSLAAKSADFSSLQFLTIKQNIANQAEPLIFLNFSKKTNKLTKFRKGDIVVFIPHHKQSTLLDNQIFKASIIEINEQSVCIRLRARQENLSIFNDYEYWHLEPDVLDSSFNAMYRGLYSFMESPKAYRQKILGLHAPTKSTEYQTYDLDKRLESKQRAIVLDAVNAKDYYLIWGPPGTGKTNMVLSNIVNTVVEHTQENILLLSYTNRAVDEICHALNELDDSILQKSLRFGSKYSTDPSFKHLLFDQQIKAINNRRGLMELIDAKRIILSTVASLASKSDIFKLKSFDTIIIDEASQILEPSIIGVLQKAKKFIMIGDHKQLPAVSTLNEKDLAVNDEALNDVYNLYSLGNSLFERLLDNAKRKGWDHAYGSLSFQGRMHTDIMEYANQYFYHGLLQAFPSITRLHVKRHWTTSKPVQEQLKEHRLLFFGALPDEEIISKGSKSEAQIIKQVITELQDICVQNNIVFEDWEIGIITPFRLQISFIKEVLEQAKISLSNIQIDTVERFQGGAKDFIIYSTAVNNTYHLSQIISKGKDEVDRKLNVALTRAKESFIMVGNQKVLEYNKRYRHLIRSISIGTLSE